MPNTISADVWLENSPQAEEIRTARDEALAAAASALAAAQATQGRERTLAFLGHSFQAAAFGAAGSGAQYITGYPGWIALLSRQRVVTKAALNFAVAGQTSTQIVARVPSVVAAAPGACVIDCITNDTALPFVDTTTNLAYAIETLRDAHIAPIVMLWTGRTGITAAQYRNFLRVNDWLRTTYGNAPGVYLVDPNELFTDPMTGAPKVALSQGDGLHPSNAGGYFVVQPLLQVLDHIFPPAPYPVSNALDIYDAANNPSGNLIPGGGMMGGTGGALAGGATGVVADGWTLTAVNAGGATVVASKGVMADGRPCQVITISGTYTGAGRYVEFAQSASVHAAMLGGRHVACGVDFEIAAGAQNVNGVQSFANILTAAGNIFPSAGGGAAAHPIPAVAFAGLIRNDPDSAVIPGAVAPTFANYVIRIGLVGNGAGSACALTIKLTSAEFRSAT